MVASVSSRRSTSRAVPWASLRVIRRVLRQRARKQADLLRNDGARSWSVKASTLGRPKTVDGCHRHRHSLPFGQASTLL
jgi:hypothetical protein